MSTDVLLRLDDAFDALASAAASEFASSNSVRLTLSFQLKDSDCKIFFWEPSGKIGFRVEMNGVTLDLSSMANRGKIQFYQEICEAAYQRAMNSATIF